MKLNENVVCAQGGGDQPAVFSSEKSIEASHFKLVYKSGGYCGNKWGCSGNSQTMLVTNSNKDILSPSHDGSGEVLYNHDMNVDEFVMKAAHPVFIKTDDALNVWFITDYYNGNNENSNEVCFDVYAHGKYSSWISFKIDTYHTTFNIGLTQMKYISSGESRQL